MITFNNGYFDILGCWYNRTLDDIDSIDWWCFGHDDEARMLKKVVYITYILDT